MSWRPAQYAQLVKMCERRGCSHDDALDVVQEALLRLLDYQRSAKVWDAESLLRRIVINLSINHYRREPFRRFAFESVNELDKWGMLVDPVPGPERSLAAEQELARVVRLLNAVSPRTCKIFIAQRGGYSYDEIGSGFAVKHRTVEKHVATAVLALTERMPAEKSSEIARPPLRYTAEASPDLSGRPTEGLEQLTAAERAPSPPPFPRMETELDVQGFSFAE